MAMDACAGEDAKDDVERSYVFVNNDSDDSNAVDVDMDMDLKSDVVSPGIEEEINRNVEASEDLSAIQKEADTEIHICGAPSVEISSSSCDSIASEMKEAVAEIQICEAPAVEISSSSSDSLASDTKEAVAEIQICGAPAVEISSSSSDSLASETKEAVAVIQIGGAPAVEISSSSSDPMASETNEAVAEIQICGAPSVEIASSSSDSIASETNEAVAEIQICGAPAVEISSSSSDSIASETKETVAEIQICGAPSVEIASCSSDSFCFAIGEFSISCNIGNSGEIDIDKIILVSEKEKIIGAVEPKAGIKATDIPEDSSETSRTEPKNGPEESSSEPKKEQPIYIIRVPRFSDNDLRDRIEKAQIDVDQKTKNRDAIRVQLQKQKDVCMEHRKKLEEGRRRERESRDAVASKRQEIDHVHSMLEKLKNKHLIADMDKKIEELQNRISHETNTLKEEKLLVREINQLRQSRDHLSSRLDSDAELREISENREQMQTRLQSLKEELDSLRKKSQLAEGVVKSARNGSDRDHEILRDLQAQYKEVDDLRQEAYLLLRDLKRESYTKNLHFYAYKDDQQAAANFVATKDKGNLRAYCSQQVERIMEMWNNDDEFRERYVEVNAQSVARRFKMHDGRSLGLDEEPVVIPAAVERRKTVDSAAHQPLTQTLTPMVTKTEEKTDSAAKPTLTSKEVKPSRDKVQDRKRVEEEELERKTKELARREQEKKRVEEEELERKTRELAWREQENKRVEEEELERKTRELARREEEMKREKEAIEERERLRLDQIAKAKDAEERKRKKAEKAQAKAEIKAQKEAEIREKKKKAMQEKKKRKKERSKAIPADPETEDNEEKETAEEPEKKPIKPVKPIKESKPLPMMLRNKGKRKLQAWLWPILTAILIFSIFSSSI